MVVLSPLVGSQCTKGEGGHHTMRDSPWGLPGDAWQPIPRAAVHGELRDGVPDLLHPENGVQLKKLWLSSFSGILIFKAFFPPANFRSPAILWEENGVKIKHSIQK